MLSSAKIAAEVARCQSRWEPEDYGEEAAAAAYAVSAELERQADLRWGEDNPDPGELIGYELPLIARSFLLDPDFLPRMAASARHMAKTLRANDRSPMPRCTADEVVYFAASQFAAATVGDCCESDPVLAQLGSGLTHERLSSAIIGLADYVLDDTDVEVLYCHEWDGIEAYPFMGNVDLVSLHPRDWFVPFGYVDESVV